MTLIKQTVYSDWLFNTQSRVLQADWFLLENNGKAIFKINMPYCKNTESKGGWVCVPTVCILNKVLHNIQYQELPRLQLNTCISIASVFLWSFKHSG